MRMRYTFHAYANFKFKLPPCRRVANNSPLKPRQNPTKWRGSGIKSMRMHPRHDDWLLLLVKRPSCKSLDHAQTECPHDLMLTQVRDHGSGYGFQYMGAGLLVKHRSCNMRDHA